MTHDCRNRNAVICALTALVIVVTAGLRPAGAQGRFLAKEDIVLLGIGLSVQPAQQTVPVNIATIVSTYLQTPGTIPEGLPPFAPDAVVEATLRGPSYPDGLDLTAKPNTPFNIPPLGVPGLHTLENIRLVSGGQVLLYGSPQSVTINVIEKLLVTQVTARPLTADEIRAKGIVFDKSSFQAYNFTAAFAIKNQTVNLSFPVVLPTLDSAQLLSTSTADVPTIPKPQLPSLRTIIPDTLKLQTQIPNLSVVGFTLKVPSLQGQNLVVPPIPGVIVIPGNIGFLDQFFSVTLMVGNVAPEGSNLVVSDLTASLALPPGNDGVLGTPDDPLRMAHTATGDSPSSQPVIQPGSDGQLGTADDVPTLGPGETGNAEFLVEGLREGTHALNISMTGTLNGLPIGPVTITGAATGAVLVRNPSFTLTFTHPDTVSAGEPYTLDVTVTNTSTSPANFVSVSLFPQNLSGATLAGESTQAIDSIAPADAATVHFKLVSKVSGKVTAATLDSDQNVAGRFELKSAVGELGVPVSPDSLVLPPQASSLPGTLRDAAIGLLGKAWAVATAPAAALPADVARFSQKIVYDRAVQVAEAGFRIALHDPAPNSAWQLEMDMAGSDVSRLPAIYPNPDDVTTAQTDFPGFDGLRRQSVRGDVLAGAVADLLAPDLTSQGVAAFHASLAQQVTYRPGHISVLIGTGGGALPLNLTLVDASGHQVGGFDSTGKVVKAIPYSDYLTFKDGSGAAVGELALVTAPAQGAFTIALSSVAGADPSTPVTLSVVVPDASGHLRQLVFQGVTAASLPTLTFASTDPYQLSVTMNGAAEGTALASASDSTIEDLPPSIEGVVQQADADTIACPDGSNLLHVGRVVAVLFSKEVTPVSAQDGAQRQDITNYMVDGNAVVGVALQPGRRIAFLALRDPIGPFVERQLTVSGVADAAGHALSQMSTPITATVSDPAAVVSGRVLQADGTPLAFANTRLFTVLTCATEQGPTPIVFGISSKTADSDGAYSWDYVLKAADRIQAVNTDTGDFREVNFSPMRDAQRLTVDAVLLGRGTLTGRTVAQDGVTPLKGTTIRVTSLTDQSQYSAVSDDTGAFTIARIPVGNIVVEAVNVASHAQITLSDYLPTAGATVTRMLALLTVEQTKVTIHTGTLTGHVYRSDGVTPVANVPVIVYYANGSQTGVFCPHGSNSPAPPECAVALATTDADGAFSIANVTAGGLHLQSFDQVTAQEGDARLVLNADSTATGSVLLAAGLGTVQGVVLDPSGNPVAGARVGGGLTLATTDASGRFTLTEVPVGQRTIVAVSDQLGSTASVTVNLVQDGQTVNATLVLASVASVAGTVYQADGTTPVASNDVYVFTDNGGGINIVGTATTDASGHYRIDHLPLGDYTVSAFRSDYTDGNIAKIALRFNSQTLKADIVFRGTGGSVHGVVYDADGKTPLKARVGVSGDRIIVAGGRVGAGFQYVQNFAIVDTDLTTGQYSFSGLLTGAFSISAVGQFSPDPITLGGTIPSPGASVEKDLQLQPTSRIAGTVFLPDGVTPAGPNIAIKYQSDAFKLVCDSDGNCDTIPQGIQEENVVTDASGQYVLPIVNAGTFTITATDPATGKSAQVRGSARAGQHVDMPIRLLGIGQLTVNVLASDARTPIPGAKVEVKQLDYPNKDVTLTADANGSAAFTGGDALSEGQLVITAMDVRNGLAGRASTKIIADGQQVTVNVYLYTASGTVSGTVFRPDGTTPVPNADVVISNGKGPIAFTVTDGSGNYAQDLIPLGPFTVDVFEAATARRGSGSGRIDLDQETVPLNVTEAALGVVSGSAVESGTLTPLVGAIVHLTTKSAGGRALPALQTQTGTDGTFSFPGIPIGDFDLSLTISQDGISGSGHATGTIQAEGETVDVPMIIDVTQPIFGRVQGTVYNPDGSPAANTQVTIHCPNCNGSAGGGTTLTAGTDGSFSLDHVQIGRFIVSAASQTSHDAGSAFGELAFDGEIADVPVVLQGLSQVNGTVVTATGQPAAGAKVVLTGYPSSGCTGPCTLFADASGAFSFINVPARTFTVAATDPVSGLKGAVGGSLTPGQMATIRIVLQPSGSIHGRVVSSSGSPVEGVTGDLRIGSEHLFVTTAADGSFSFDTVPLVGYALSLQDPLGTGAATRTGTVTGAVDLGDISLADVQLAVASAVPLASSIGVAVDAPIQVVFNEAIDFSTATAAHFVLSGPDGATIPETVAVGTGGTTVTLTPVNPLATQTAYTLRVTGVADALGRSLSSDYTESFTTVDQTPPGIVEFTPAINGTGVALAATVRIQFSEPIDPARFTGPPITLTGPAGAVASRIDYTLGNTTVVLTPLQPLSTGTAYHVQALPAFDLSGNAQPTPLDYTFTTTTLTPPQITALTAAAPTVIQGTSDSVTAEVGNQDVAFVDFYLNDVFAGTVSSAPFAFHFQATPALGAPGSQIKVSAVATDTTGLRGQTRVSTLVTVAADQPPVVTITAPAGGLTVKNGDRVTVTVHATDDVGVVQMGYGAGTGHPADAAATTISPASLDQAKTFGFNVPADAAPNSTIQIQASGVDTAGHTATAIPVTLTVLDSVMPTVTITGATTGSKVTPGQQTTVVVSAQDLGGIASIAFTASGAASFTQTRTISPAQNAAVTSFTFPVASTALPGQSVTITATATDQSGNVGTAASVILPVADTIAPTIALRTDSGHLTMVRGTTVDVVADAEDGLGVSRIDLAGSGAFSVTDSKQVSPPVGSAEVSFAINVPADLQPGQVLNLQATATDTSGNVSFPAVLSLTTEALPSVVLPSSAVLVAGQNQDVSVQLSDPAPAGGLTVTFDSADATVASVVTPSVSVAAGETSGTVTVAGVGGGTTTLTGSVQGVARGTMTLTVRGGIVSGTVYDPQFNPVAGAQVTVGQSSTTTDADGNYFIEGEDGPNVTVQVLDPASRLLGVATGTMNEPRGYVNLNVVLIAAGTIDGTVLQPDGHTPAGQGVQVSLFKSTDLATAVASTFTDASGAYSFPLVAMGDYTLVATDTSGNEGRSSTSLTTTGQALTVPITFLGRGTVNGTVLDANGDALANATVTLEATSTFGAAPYVTVNAGSDGTFSFPNVFIGTFTVAAHDPTSGQGGTAAGQIDSAGQTVTVSVQVAPSATLQGTVFRSDGTTVVPNAHVTVQPGSGSSLQATTDSQGQYSFAYLPLGSYSITARDPGTRGLGATTASLATNGTTVTADISLLPQGSIVATITDANGTPVIGASVTVTVGLDGFQDELSGQSGSDGTVILENVLAGSFSINAFAGGLTGRATGTVAGGQTTRITVALEPTGSVTGTIFEPDGQTPATDAKVAARTSGYNMPATAVNADGTFRLDGLPLGSYTLYAWDGTGRERAFGTFQVTANGQVVNQSLSYVALGTVSGRVINPDASSASNLIVQLQSLNTQFGRFVSATTNAAGFYEIDGVPAGAFTLSTGNAAQQLLGEGSGTITADGQTVTVDILLQSNAVTLPIDLYDGNGFVFEVAQDGSNPYGENYVFHPSYQAYGAPWLDIVANGTPNRFTGNSIGTYENHQRSVTIQQQNLAGLTVTRKVFVPQDGYFARYLEIVQNPGTAPITVDVRVTSNLSGYASASAIRATSSGDAALSVADETNPDRWAVFDDSIDADPFVRYGTPAVAFTFDGPGAAGRVRAATFDSSSRQLVYAWTNVTVPAGASVAFLHFISQETSQASAAASAERLVQLPPEALSGLSAAEVQEIQNFAVPSDGIGTVAPLPGRLGKVTGHVFEYDHSTPIPSSLVSFQSRDPLFGRTYTTSTDSSGAFSFAGALTTDGNTMLVPLEPFTLSAEHPFSATTSPSVSGTFAAGETTATQDVVFSNTSIVSGTVRRTSGATVGTGSVYIQGDDPFSYCCHLTGIAADGTFSLRGIPAGTYTLTVNVPNSQGSPLLGTLAVTVTAGQATPADITMPATGGVSGLAFRADGTPSVGARIDVRSSDSSFVRTAYTDTSGAFLLADIPVGSYTLIGYEPRTNVQSSYPITIVQDQTVAQNVTMVAVGTLQVQVDYARGVPAPSAFVSAYVGDQHFYRTGTTNALGVATLSNVPAGAFAITASDPDNGALQATATGTLVSESDNIQVTLAFPPAGTISGHVTYGDGSAASNIRVELHDPSGDQYLASSFTDSAGSYSFSGRPIGTDYLLRAYRRYPYGDVHRDVAAPGLTADGQVETIDIVLPAIASVQVTALRLDGSPIVGAQIQWHDSTFNYFNFAGYTDANGSLTLTGVHEGSFTIRLFDPHTYALLKELNGSVAATDEAGTVPFMIQLTQPSGTVQGTVFAADGITPVPGADVIVLNTADNNWLAETTAATDGTYTVSDVQPGDQGFTIEAHSPSDSEIGVAQTGSFASQGQVVPINLTLPIIHGTVQGTVFANDGTTPIPGAEVGLFSSDEDYPFEYTTADANGAYQLADVWVPADGFNIEAYAPNDSDEYSLLVTQPATLTSQGETLTLNLTIPVVLGTVHGVVYGGDGVTPVPDAEVDLTGSAVGPPSECEECYGLDEYTRTGPDGSYSFPDIYLPADGVHLEAYDYGQESAQDIVLTSQHQQLEQNLTLPLTVIKGTLTYEDGSAPSEGEAFATAEDGDTYWARDVYNGSYAIFGAPEGSVTVTGQDSDSGLTTSGTGTVPPVGSAVTLDLVFPPSGTVTGTVTDASGNPVDSAQVVLVSTGLGFNRYTSTDSTGAFSFDHVPVGTFYVQGSFYDSRDEYVSASGQIASSEDTETVTLAASAGGIVSGQVLDAGGTPVSDEYVSIQAFGSTGPLGNFTVYTYTDPSGMYEFDNVPLGLVQVTAGIYSNVGIANDALSSTPLTLNVTLGNAVTFVHDLDGTDGFRYDVDEDGELDDGGTVDGHLDDAYDGDYRLSINGMSFGYVDAGLVELGGRQVVLGPMSNGPLVVSRKIFVPAAGGFARYLEVLSNPTPVAVDATVTVRGNLGSDSNTRLDVTPADTDNTYAVTDQSGYCCDPALGHVFAGLNAPVPVSSVFFANGNDSPSYSWNVQVPAGGTVILMHFALQRDPSDPNAAAAAAQALRDLTDPEALTGLTAAEKAEIQNFVVPQ